MLRLLPLGQSPTRDLLLESTGSASPVELHLHKTQSTLPGLQEQANQGVSSLGLGGHEEPPWAASCSWTGWSSGETEGGSPPRTGAVRLGVCKSNTPEKGAQRPWLLRPLILQRVCSCEPPAESWGWTHRSRRRRREQSQLLTQPEPPNGTEAQHVSARQTDGRESPAP